MKPLLSLLCLVVFVISACTKDKASSPGYGVYIEKSLRLDTINFNLYKDPATGEYAPMFDLRSNGRFPLLYSYEFKDDSICVINLLSSAYHGNIFQYFQWSVNKRSFKTKKFFGRDALPDIVEFVKLK